MQCIGQSQRRAPMRVVPAQASAPRCPLHLHFKVERVRTLVRQRPKRLDYEPDRVFRESAIHGRVARLVPGGHRHERRASRRYCLTRRIPVGNRIQRHGPAALTSCTRPRSGCPDACKERVRPGSVSVCRASLQPECEPVCCSHSVNPVNRHIGNLPDPDPDVEHSPRGPDLKRSGNPAVRHVKRLLWCWRRHGPF